MALVVEPRHRVVGLRRKLGAGDPPAGERLEHRKPAAAQQAVQQRGDEHGFAGARQTGDAKPDGGMQQMFAEFRERARREPGLFNDIGDDRRHGAQDVGLAAGRRKSFS